MTDPTFFLCLSHDVDRVTKTFQSVYYALAQRAPRHLADLAPTRNPYWQFETIRDLEADLGVRSSFYFLGEQRLVRDRPVGEWVHPRSWRLYAGRYDLDAPRVAREMRRLHAGGWEVGLHGSYQSYADDERLAAEKERLESVLGANVAGVRQHYLNLERPETWRYHADVGLQYDASLGSSSEVGFQYGHGVVRPFDDEFVVFPLTAMEIALFEGRSFEEAWTTVERLLAEAAANRAVMTVLWHQRYFSERDFPGYTRLYRRLIEAAQDRGAWVGPLGDLYDRLDDNPGVVPERTGSATALGP